MFWDNMHGAKALIKCTKNKQDKYKRVGKEEKDNTI